jgi:hypothetical protein
MRRRIIIQSPPPLHHPKKHGKLDFQLNDWNGVALMNSGGMRFFSNSDIRFNLILLACCLSLWIGTLLAFGSNYPVNYDSINYALAIKYDFDIGKCQPHAWGYLYHILICRLWLPIIANPFRVQQAQNVLYLLSALLFMIPWGRAKAWHALVPATLPLSLFFSSTSVIHAASFAASAAIAFLIVRLEGGRLHPLVLTAAFSLFIGFRQDLAMFMGPVVAVALLRHRCTWKDWLAIIGSGVALNAVWYVTTSWSSGWLSPWKEANAIVRPFNEASALVYGAPLFQSLRVITRFFLYLPAVLGPGGLCAVLLVTGRCDKYDLLFLGSAAAPFIMYGILIYMGIPGYYATILGFVFAWLSIRKKIELSARTAIILSVANVLFFLFIPAPLTKNYADFRSRPLLNSVVKQASYVGAVGRKVVTGTREFETFLDRSLARCASFAVRDKISYDGIPYFRAWPLLAEQWRNRYTPVIDSAECFIGTVKANERPDRRFGDIGIWYRRERCPRDAQSAEISGR